MAHRGRRRSLALNTARADQATDQRRPQPYTGQLSFPLIARRSHGPHDSTWPRLTHRLDRSPTIRVGRDLVSGIQHDPP